MVLTVEPGLYFNNYQIDKGLNNPTQAQYIVKERLEGMRTFGGARIEDMVRCTEAYANSLLRLACVSHVYYTSVSDRHWRVRTGCRWS
jgi:hypothetical protein